MRLLADDRWIGLHGIGRFAREVISRLPSPLCMPAGLRPTHPLDPAWTALHIARLRPDVYFEPGYNPPLANRVPFVFTLHDLIHLRMPEESSIAKRLYYERIVKPATQSAYRVLTVSHFSKSEIVAWAGIPGERVVVVGNGVSQDYCPSGARFQLERPYVLFVGNRRPHKNVRGLIAAFAASGCASDVVLLLSGERDPKTMRWIREAGLEESQVRFSGPIAESHLPDYYRGAIALAIPSLYEGFGLPALEAMACGTPVLAGRRASLPEVVGGAALLVDPTDTAALAHGLRRLVRDEALRAHLSARGVDRAARFDWDTTAKRVLAILASAAETRHRA